MSSRLGKNRAGCRKINSWGQAVRFISGTELLTRAVASSAVFVGLLFGPAGHTIAATVDGVISSGEYTGGPISVIYNPAAPSGNFGAPTDGSNTVAYDVYITSDTQKLYGAFVAKPQSGDAYDPGLRFVNLYIDTDPVNGGSDLGFEIVNDRAFVPGGSGYFENSDTFGLDWILSPSSPDPSIGTVLEFSLPISYFVNDPQGVGFPKLTASSDEVRFNLVQAFGYAVAGGQLAYGDERLGRETLQVSAVPLPAAVYLFGSALGALGGVTWRRRRKPAAA